MWQEIGKIQQWWGSALQWRHIIKRLFFILNSNLYIYLFKGINQNELIYEFMLEKSWRHTLNLAELADWYK